MDRGSARRRTGPVVAGLCEAGPVRSAPTARPLGVADPGYKIGRTDATAVHAERGGIARIIPSWTSSVVLLFLRGESSSLFGPVAEGRHVAM